MKERIIQYITELDDDSKITLHNAYCLAGNNMDDYIYSMAEFDEINQDTTPWNIACMIAFGCHFCAVDDYWMFDGYGNIETIGYVDGHVFPSDIADYILRNDDDLENEDIRDILKESEE